MAYNNQSIKDFTQPFIDEGIKLGIKEEISNILLKVLDLLGYYRDSESMVIDLELKQLSDAKYFFHLGRSMLATDLMKTLKDIIK